MRKLFLLMVILFMAAPAVMLAQSTMTDQQVINFVLEEREKGTSQTEIITKLMQRGVDVQQIQRIRRKYERQINNSGLGSVADKAMDNATSRMRTNNGQGRKEKVASSQRVGSQVAWKEKYSEDDPTFLQMQSELGDMLPIDSIAMLKRILDEQRDAQNKIFGHDLFNNEALTFEPNMNIATPRDYVIGPGDAVIIDVYGASQESFNETVSPDGFVTI